MSSATQPIVVPAFQLANGTKVAGKLVALDIVEVDDQPSTQAFRVTYIPWESDAEVVDWVDAKTYAALETAMVVYEADSLQ